MFERTTYAYVIVSPDFGIYFDSAAGEHFWSRHNPADKDFAITFLSIAGAEAYVQQLFTNANCASAYTFHLVTPSEGKCATFADLTRAGLGHLLPPPNPPPRPDELRRYSSYDKNING